MSPDKIRIAIAESVGVIICDQCKHRIDPEYCHCGDQMEGHGYQQGHTGVPMGCVCGFAQPQPKGPGLPRYTEDLNAIVPVCREFKEGDFTLFSRELYCIINRDEALDPYDLSDVLTPVEIAGMLSTSKPEQFCEAYCKVKGIWEEDRTCAICDTAESTLNTEGICRTCSDQVFP